MPEQSPPPSDSSDPRNDPMTPRLMARLFVVPLLIVVMIVFSSAAVVLLFGWISESKDEHIDALVTRMENGVGNLIAGMAMLPEDREIWQAASTLARRLQSNDPADFPAGKREEVARRLGEVLKKTRGVPQKELGREMQQYLMETLGHLGQAESVPSLVDFALDEKHDMAVRTRAVKVLIDMRNGSGAGAQAARNTWPELVPLLSAPDVVMRLHAVAAIGALASHGDKGAINALSDAYRSGDREVVWNSSVALAKLGSALPAPMLQDMLRRDYWEKDVKMDLPDAPGAGARMLPPAAVNEYLKVAIDAAAALKDPRLRAGVEQLTNDPTPRVKDHARKAIEAWKSTTSAPA